MDAEAGPTKYLQTGTGQIAILYFDVDLGEWAVDLYRTVDSTCTRMASWASRNLALEALERMQFEEYEPSGLTPLPNEARKRA